MADDIAIAHWPHGCSNNYPLTHTRPSKCLSADQLLYFQFLKPFIWPRGDHLRKPGLSLRQCPMSTLANERTNAACQSIAQLLHPFARRQIYTHCECVCEQATVVCETRNAQNSVRIQCSTPSVVVRSGTQIPKPI